MITKKNTCEVAIHFNKETHVLSDFDFVIIEQICNSSDNNSLDDRLLTREAYWNAQLSTLQPYGLNKRSEFNSRNRIRCNETFLYAIVYKCSSNELLKSFKGSIKDFVTKPKYRLQYQSSGA